MRGGSGRSHTNLRHVEFELPEENPGEESMLEHLVEMYGGNWICESEVHGKFGTGDLDLESSLFRRRLKP